MKLKSVRKANKESYNSIVLQGTLFSIQKMIPSYVITLLLVLTGIKAMTLQAQCEPSSMKIGMGLGGTNNYTHQQVFKDFSLSQRSWSTKNSSNSDFETKELNFVPLDENGYPKSLPVLHNGGQITLFSVLTTTGRMPLDDYVLLYDGEADIKFSGALEFVEKVREGYIKFKVVSAGNGIYEIRSTPASNPITNIRIIQEKYIHNYTTAPLHPEFVDKIAPFPVLRTMDFTTTNNWDTSWNELNTNPSEFFRYRDWEERIPKDYYTHRSRGTKSKGMAYEHIITMANALNKDLWINIPHSASDDYVINMARLFKEQLKPNLTIHLEFSNELWNFQFMQAHFFDKMKNADGTYPGLPGATNYYQAYSTRTKQVFKKWMEVYRGQEQRVIRVVGAQAGNFFTLNSILKPFESEDWDALAITFYLNISNKWQGPTFRDDFVALPNPTPADVIRFTRADYEYNKDQGNWKKAAEIARSQGKKMMCYEGGTHVIHSSHYEGALLDMMIEANRSQGMMDIYDDLIDHLREENYSLIMPFIFSGRASKYGDWGHYSNTFQRDTPLKVRTLLENMSECTPPPVSDEFKLNTDVDTAQGSITVNPKATTYVKDTEVTLTATPKSGYVFENWSGDVTGTSNSTAVVMDTDKTVKANFKKVNTTPPVGTFRYLRVRVAKSDTFFMRELEWAEGGATYPNPKLTLADVRNNVITSSGGATVWRAYDGDTNSHHYAPGSTSYWTTLDLGEGNAISPTRLRFVKPSWNRVLSAIVAEGSNDNENWTTLYSSTTADITEWNALSEITIPLRGSQPTVEQFRITTTANDGTIAIAPAQSIYGKGTEITLTATPNPGFVFENWSGDATGTATTIKVTMNSDKTIEAHFKAVSAFRYLRVRVEKSDAFHMQELEWFEGSTAFPNPKLTLADVRNNVITSSGGLTVWRAYDGNTATHHYAPGSTPYWTTLDLGEGNVISPTRLRFVKPSWSKVLRVIVAEGSNDNINWTTLYRSTTADIAEWNQRSEIIIPLQEEISISEENEASKTLADSFEVYNDPNKERRVIMTFTTYVTDDMDIRIYNMSGSLVKSFPVKKGTKPYIAFNGTLKSGLHIVKAIQGKTSATKKIIVK